MKSLMAQLSWMRVISAVSARASEVVGLRVRLQSLYFAVKRGGKVYTKVACDTKTEMLMPLIARKR